MNSKQLDKIFNLLFPIFRSITGNGYLKSLQIFKKYMNLKLIKYRSGKKVFDWGVPDEWVIKDAHVIYKGKKIILLAPVVKSRKGNYQDLFQQIIKKGFTQCTNQ